MVAARTLMSEDLSAWRCQAAPRSDEVVWGNLGFRAWERTGGWVGGGCVRVGMPSGPQPPSSGCPYSSTLLMDILPVTAAPPPLFPWPPLSGWTAGRNMAMWAAFWAMAAFFMIPVTAVQGLLSMNSFLGWVLVARGGRT